PGESRFYLSLQDDLMRLFNSQMAESLMTRAGFPDDLPLESKIVTRGIASAQSQVEGRNFEIRKNVLKYDDVLSRQRSVIYSERRRVLEGEDMADQIQHFTADVLTAYVEGATAEGSPETWDLDALWTALKAVYPVSITPEEVVEQADGPTRISAELIANEVISDAQHAYAAREEQFGSDNMRQLERRVVLSVLDRKWREHLYEMDYLKEGIGLRAMAQRDPLVEYQREGFQLFSAMTDAIKEESVGFLFNLEVKVAEPDPEGPVVTVESAAQDEGNGPDVGESGTAGGATAERETAAPPATRRAAKGAPSGRRAAGALVAKGLEGPDRTAPLQYSAPSVDGDAELARIAVEPASHGASGTTTGPNTGRTSDVVNREDRRKAERLARKKR
ncbi:MAG TPA: preprotein translocase subunit SecA, partial [Cellulomonas sp.]